MIVGLILIGCDGGGAPPQKSDAADVEIRIDTLVISSSDIPDASFELPFSTAEVGRSDVLFDTVPDIALEAVSPTGGGACLPGATALDCQRCGSASSACSQACPAVDCRVSPAPAECTTVCTTCCTCGLAYSNTYFWTGQYSNIPCSTVCSDNYARWLQLMADPAMTACTTSGDCTVVGGQSRMDPCNGGVAIGGCGVAANAAAYQASAAPPLEKQYFQQCPHAPKAYDCGLGYATCSQGKCVIENWACCFGCTHDGGLFTPVDASQDAANGGGPASLDGGGPSIDGSRG